MLPWAIEEYLSMPILLIKMLMANLRNKKNIQGEKIYFGENYGQYVLFFRPPGAKKRNHLIVYIHGGGWIFGLPGIYGFIGHFFVRAGYPTLLVGHRSSLFHKFPDQMEDMEKGLKIWLEKGDPLGCKDLKIILCGHSSGGQLAALMALHQGKKFAFPREGLSGVITLGAPLDLSGKRSFFIKKLIKVLVKTPKTWHQANPIEQITAGGKIPFFCIHGRKDIFLGTDHAVGFIKKYNRYNGKLGKLLIAGDLHHSDMIQIFLHPREETKAMLKWIEERQ